MDGRFAFSKSLRGFIPFGLLLALIAAGCSDSTEPQGTADLGSRDFQGAVDPGHGTFLLETIDSTTGTGVPIQVDLIGSNLEVNAELSRVSFDVAVRNRGDVPLHAPGEIVVFNLVPWTVYPLNADRADCPPRMGPLPDSRDCRFAYDYSALLGDDAILSPGEVSQAKRWVFQVPGLTPFSFGAGARFGLTPDRPRIAGVVFADANENGHLDPGEPGFGGGTIQVNGPGLDSLVVTVPPEGAYAIPIENAGLYTLFAVPPPTFAPVRSTTPNPLQVLILNGADGRPQSYLHADFGFANERPDSIPDVGFWDGPPDSLPQDSYGLLRIGLEGLVLRLRVGFSGCSPDQPFALFMVGTFMESHPVQAAVVLAHDSRGEMCDAYFERSLAYDLSPILRRAHELYGVSEVLVNFRTPNGEVHQFRLVAPTADKNR
jgi:hypothetical protein